LKPFLLQVSVKSLQLFLLYSPLNQGLKPDKFSFDIITGDKFLLYSPLNQGLKRMLSTPAATAGNSVFTLQSIKSRIETMLKFKRKIN